MPNTYDNIKRVIVVIAKTTPRIIVILSRFFSTIPEPSKVSTMPENKPDIPPPLPACNKINSIMAMEAAICTA